MSQKASRKSAISEDKEKRQTNSPVKEMKKKMAANAEKEKQAAEKVEKPTEKTVEKQTDKNTNKQADKSDKSAEKSEKNVVKPDKTAEKTDKSAEKSDKNAQKSDKTVSVADNKSEKIDKNVEKSDKVVLTDKKSEKNVEKKEPQAGKSKEDVNKEDKNEKCEKSEPKGAECKAKQNGRAHNGAHDVTLGARGAEHAHDAHDALNGTVSADSEDDDVMLVIDDQDQDELFPELTYDDASDVECFEPPTPESAPSRSFTRRSQVKAARTPETPRPASGKHAERETEDPKDSKLLKLKEEAPPTDRKLRSADSPKPETKKDVKKPEKESPRKSQEEKEDGKQDNTQEAEKSDSKSVESEKKDMDVVVEVENEAAGVARGGSKPDTNYSKSRVKVSPYRRARLDHTDTSLIANYTGNNTTMEMDITETSSLISEEPAAADSPYLRGLRSIRGRDSYKPLKEMNLRHVANRSTRSTTTLNDSHNRPTGTVVGRKRKPDSDLDNISVASEAAPEPRPAEHGAALSKRMKLLDRLAVPFRRTSTARNAEIVGINTDLPLTAPVVSAAESFDPESLKSAGPVPDAPVAVPLPAGEDRDSKRCAIM